MQLIGSNVFLFLEGRWIPLTFWFFYRCADKILNQLEIHADRVIATNGTASQNSAANANRNNLKQIATSLKNHHLTTDPVMIWNLCTYPEYFSLIIFFFYIFFFFMKRNLKINGMIYAWFRTQTMQDNHGYP